MNVPKPKRRHAFYLAIALGVSLAWPAKAAEPRWPAGPYTYLVVDQDLRAVLEQFGRNMNLPVRLSNEVQAHRLKGQLGAPSAKAFLQALCNDYQLVWYFDGATIYIMPQNAVRNAFLELGPVALDDLKQRLANIGIADERFPLNSTGDAAIVSLAAPPAYTSVVREILASMKSAAMAAPKTNKAVAVKEGIAPQLASRSLALQGAEHQGAPPAPCSQCAAPDTMPERSPPASSATTTDAPAQPGMTAPAARTVAAQESSSGAKTNERLSTVQKTSRMDHLADNAANDEKVRVLVFRGGPR